VADEILSTRPLRRTSLALTELGFGAAPLGNLFTAVSDSDARAAVDAAWDAGIRYFDVAPHYGLGLAERRLGAALAERPRAEFVLSSKVGRLLYDSGVVAPDDGAGGFDLSSSLRRQLDYSADGVRRSIADSLERIGTDHLDIAFVHDPPEGTEDQIVAEALPALCAMRDAGELSAVGVGVNEWELAARFVGHSDLDVVLLAGRYTLLEQDSLPGLLDLCQARGVSVIAAAPFNSGLLARDTPPADARWNYEPAPAEILDRARALAGVCAAAGVRLPAAALQFPLGHPAVVSVLAGMRSVEEVAMNAALLAAPIPPALWTALKDLGLLARDAPTPPAGM
jgi:D-threo-aldose 1-dehydrogenase